MVMVVELGVLLFSIPLRLETSAVSVYSPGPWCASPSMMKVWVCGSKGRRVDRILWTCCRGVHTQEAASPTADSLVHTRCGALLLAEGSFTGSADTAQS